MAADVRAVAPWKPVVRGQLEALLKQMPGPYPAGDGCSDEVRNYIHMAINRIDNDDSDAMDAQRGLPEEVASHGR